MSELSIQQFVRYAMPTLVRKGKRNQANRWKCPNWPPDLFAISAALLEKSGAYTLFGASFCPVTEGGWRDIYDRSSALFDVGYQWSTAITEALKELPTIDPDVDVRRSDAFKALRDVSPPQLVVEWWKILRKNKQEPVSQIRHDRSLFSALINIAAACDEAMAGVGLLDPGQHLAPGRTSPESPTVDRLHFRLLCDLLLQPIETSALEPDSGGGSSLCRQISSSRFRVLPKSQTPSAGLSLRSFSHSLALCPPIDITANWFSYGIAPDVVDQEHCNVLIVPWPYEIYPRQFQPCNPLFASNGTSMPGHARWFKLTYSTHQTAPGQLIDHIENLINEAERSIERVHVVVLPELAVTRSQFELLRDALTSKQIVLIAGVLDETANPKPAKNLAIVAAPTHSPELQPFVEYAQQKHHRWKLDNSQIVRYGLSATLDPKAEWWEGIEISTREVNFMRLSEWLSTCVLLCEDLAQYDPVGRFVRAVAPDLVVALLMDGPQLEARWPARYATVLADDPGCAVLTVTSLGMANLSRMRSDTSQPVPRTIALWKDPIEGLVPINLPRECNAAVITIRSKETVTWTADGRENHSNSYSPVFGGVHFI